MRRIYPFVLMLCTAVFIFAETAITGADLSKSSPKNRKKYFTESLLPVINDVRKEIEESREKIIELSQKKEHTEEEAEFLKNHFSRYRVKEGNYQKLLETMIFPPPSLILAQASLESAWGTSQLSKSGNNLFGMRSFETEEPRVRIGKKVYYRKYSDVRESIKDYVVNLSRHSAYRELRKGIKQGEDSLSLVKYLGDYAENPTYRQKLISVLNSNNFTKHDI